MINRTRAARRAQFILSNLMDTLPLLILGILLLLAVFDLTVGVSNDAVNFLNSAVGSRVATRSVILAVAAVGIVVGASFSSGMMEIARSGVFVPAMFSFNDIMLLFLAVMLTDVILLDLFNTFGMPTSTTVSLVFELLGAAVAVAAYHLWIAGDASAADLGAYINSSKAFAIVTGIFCSVGVAFTCGVAVMWFSRLLFSFRYRKAYGSFGALWAALSLTAISYFAVFKGMKSSTLLSQETLAMLDANLAFYVAGTFLVWTALMLICQFVCRVNVLKVTVLAGTMALAMAFAGNDLVNFIGVFMAAETSYHIADAYAQSGGDVAALTMDALAQPVVANHAYLLIAGLIMVAALCLSKKARTVTDTEINLARKNGGMERFGSSQPARLLVRYTLAVIRFVARITPRPVARFVERRFEPLPPGEDGGASFDLIRASVNLTLAALLISMATSLKLPLSTTYVTFMVGMGSSLADRAWGRDSAVYRITGVLTVIGGWFLTAFAAAAGAFVTAMILMTCGWVGIVAMGAAAGLLIVRSARLHRKKHRRHEEEEIDVADDKSLREFGIATAETLGRALDIYARSIHGLMREDRKTLKKLRKETKSMLRMAQERKNRAILPALQGLAPAFVDRGQCLFRVAESAQATVESLTLIVQAGFNHLDNNHEGLTREQVEELQALHNRVAKFYPQLCSMLMRNDFTHLERALDEASDLSGEFAEAIRRHLLHGSEDESQTRNGILYLNLLNETRAMIRKSYSLLKDQRDLLHC